MTHKFVPGGDDSTFGPRGTWCAAWLKFRSGDDQCGLAPSDPEHREHEAERDRMRGTGGNLFIGPDATRADLLRSINDQLGDIHQHAVETGRVLDIAEITISTKRIKSGNISVSVSADLGPGESVDSSG